jgi:hypothetical protein
MLLHNIIKMTDNVETINESFLAIDIETGGCMVTKHPLVAIGTCFLTPCKRIVKKRFVLDFDKSKFEQRCTEQYWNKYPDLLKEFTDSVKSSIKDFANYLDELDTKYPDLIILSDNPAFDINFINYYFETFLNRLPISYRLNLDNDYRVVTDVESFAYIFHGGKGNWADWKTLILEHGIDMHGSKMDHCPENDAEYILRFFLGLKKLKESDQSWINVGRRLDNQPTDYSIYFNV